MQFSMKPLLADCESLPAFFERWQVGKEDLLITNEYVLAPWLAGAQPPCRVLYQEQYGKGEPTDVMVDAMLEAAAGQEYRRVIALGGGTVIDIAKLFVFGGNLRCRDIFDKGAALARQRRLVIVPTTCGTGSEVTNISIIGFVEKNTKLGLAVPALYADEAVLIGSLLQTLPYEVFATSSIDALIHAMESYISPKASLFTRSLGRSAKELILNGYRRLAERPPHTLPGKDEWQEFLAASTMAGVSFGNAGCAAVHALSYPIGGRYHVSHGKANYMVFREVFAAYQAKNADLAPLEQVLAGVLGETGPGVWDALFRLLGRIYDNQSLGSLGADAAACREMAESVVQNQQRLLVNSPLPLDVEDIAAIYLRCL